MLSSLSGQQGRQQGLGLKKARRTDVKGGQIRLSGEEGGGRSHQHVCSCLPGGSGVPGSLRSTCFCSMAFTLRKASSITALRTLSNFLFHTPAELPRLSLAALTARKLSHRRRQRSEISLATLRASIKNRSSCSHPHCLSDNGHAGKMNNKVYTCTHRVSSLPCVIESEVSKSSNLCSKIRLNQT